MILNFTKEQLVQILVIGMVLIFIFEIFAMTISTNNQEKNNNSLYSGAVIANMKVLSYAPYIKVPLKGFNKSDLNLIEHVDLQFSRPIESEEVYLVSVDDGINVNNVYKELLGMGYSGSTELRISLYNATYVETGKPFPSASFSFIGEPIYQVDRVYRSTFIGTVNDSDQWVSQLSVIPIDENITMLLNWSLQKIRYIYAIPWEYRNGYENITNYSSIGEFQGKNYFLSNISKNTSYVVSVINDRHLVLSNFTDRAIVLADFPDAVFPDSEFRTDLLVELPFNYTYDYVYYAFLPKTDANYYYGNIRVFYNSSENLTGGDTLLKITTNGIKVISVQVVSVGS